MKKPSNKEANTENQTLGLKICHFQQVRSTSKQGFDLQINVSTTEKFGSAIHLLTRAENRQKETLKNKPTLCNFVQTKKNRRPPSKANSLQLFKLKTKLDSK
jgi:hypothetical protein